MPYWIVSPSTNNNFGPFMHSVAFQIDGMYSVAEDEGRAHLKHNIMNFLNTLLHKNSKRF
jgi:hypothetical protein